MNWWKTALAVFVGGIMAIVAAWFLWGLEIGRASEESRLRFMERAREDYFERTGKQLPPAREMLDEFNRSKDR